MSSSALYKAELFSKSLFILYMAVYHAFVGLTTAMRNAKS